MRIGQLDQNQNPEHVLGHNTLEKDGRSTSFGASRSLRGLAPNVLYPRLMDEHSFPRDRILSCTRAGSVQLDAVVVVFGCSAERFSKRPMHGNSLAGVQFLLGQTVGSTGRQSRPLQLNLHRSHRDCYRCHGLRGYSTGKVGQSLPPQCS
jgi:hypothetical protein